MKLVLKTKGERENESEGVLITYDISETYDIAGMSCQHYPGMPSRRKQVA